MAYVNLYLYHTPQKRSSDIYFTTLIRIYLYRYIVCANFFVGNWIAGFTSFKLIEINVAMAGTSR